MSNEDFTERIKKTLAAFERHHGRVPTLDELAKALDVHPRILRSKLRDATATTGSDSQIEGTSAFQSSLQELFSPSLLDSGAPDLGEIMALMHSAKAAGGRWVDLRWRGRKSKSRFVLSAQYERKSSHSRFSLAEEVNGRFETLWDHTTDDLNLVVALIAASLGVDPFDALPQLVEAPTHFDKSTGTDEGGDFEANSNVIQLFPARRALSADIEFPQVLYVNQSEFKSVETCLIEPDNLVGFGLRRIIDEIVTVTASCSVASEAESLAHRLRPQLVITELALEESALEMCAKFRNELQCKIIIASDLRQQTRYFHRLQRLGITGFWLKCSGPSALARAIKTVMEGETYVDPTLQTLIEQSPSASSNPFDQAELQVLLRLKLTNKEIADELNLDTKTVAEIVQDLKEKLKVNNRSNLRSKLSDFELRPLPFEPSLNPETGLSYEQTLAELMAETLIACEHLKAMLRHFQITYGK